MIEHISFAPLEGITVAAFRHVHRDVFGGADTYYTPFLATNQHHHFKHRDEREYLPYDPQLIPQVLTANAADFIWAAREIASAGYEEVNLNLGCPSPTVVTKGKGSGMLADPERLKVFFEEVFAAGDLPRISVKTRIGYSDASESAAQGEVLGRFPFCEVIIHPRVRTDLYRGTPNLEAFREMAAQLTCPVCYNGDIRTAEDAARILEALPGVRRIMIGRGLVADPALAREIRGGKAASGEEMRTYLDAMWDAYREAGFAEKDILFKMKELWFYLGSRYPDGEDALARIRKSKDPDEYRVVLRDFFDND